MIFIHQRTHKHTQITKSPLKIKHTKNLYYYSFLIGYRNSTCVVFFISSLASFSSGLNKFRIWNHNSSWRFHDIILVFTLLCLVPLICKTKDICKFNITSRLLKKLIIICLKRYYCSKLVWIKIRLLADSNPLQANASLELLIRWVFLHKK